MSRRNGWESWEERGDRYYDDLERNPFKTFVKWFFGFVAVVIVLGIIFSIVGFASNWWQKGVEIVSPPNVEKQYTRIIDNWEGLYASAENACLAIKESDEDSPTFVESPEAAYAATFRRIVIDYNRRMANLFEAGIVGPPGYPDEIPRSLGANDDWCEVPLALDDLKATAER